MDQARVREILRALLSALGYAHARGTIHRDVKAENVLFDETDRPLLADFGIALRRGYGTRVTTTGMAVGSTAYMAPDQARGEEVDHRTDLYAIGVLAWEMLTGKLPYEARSEEHTSELQSLMRISYSVFCFKKKTKKNTTL